MKKLSGWCDGSRPLRRREIALTRRLDRRERAIARLKARVDVRGLVDPFAMTRRAA